MGKHTTRITNYLLLWILAAGIQFSYAQSVVVDATIDSLQILIGEQTKIKLEVTLDANQRALFPMYRDTLVTGVEVLEMSKPDTVYLNEKQRLQITQDYLITSFDSALYYLPPMEVLVDGVPYYSQPLALKVHTFPDEMLTDPDMFFGPKSIMKPPFVWEDWKVLFWLAILAIPLMLLLIYFIIRFNDSKLIIKRVKIEPKLPPHQLAMQEIERIKTERIWQKGHSKEYYTELTDTIRTYIKDRFGFNALEMTSSEIIEELSQGENKEKLKDLCELFQTADLVKFAKHTPLMNENDMNLVNAIEFIDQTKIDTPVNPNPEPKEVTIEEKRSKRSKLILLGCMIGLSIAIITILMYVGMRIFNSI